MARKRSRDDDEIEPAPAPKRERPSLDADADGSGGESASDDEARVVAAERSESESDGQFEERLSDDDGEYEEVTKADALHCLKRGHAHSGVMESVRVDRFMCHECLEYKLGPNVNIINGPNGSGKSAIVAAVQIGLGARSSATDRAAKLEEHIMYGKNDAIISIKIRNRVNPDEIAVIEDADDDEDDDDEEDDEEESDEEDDDMDDGEGRRSRRSKKKKEKKTKAPAEDSSTYRHSVYGDTIIIERTLKRGSGSTWKVKNSRGKSVKEHLNGVTERREVQNICDHFGFMVDNPVAVLTQTLTKKFLAEGKPTSHHELFYKATLLGPLAESLAATMKVCDQIRLMIRQKKENHPVVAKQVEELRIAYEESNEMKTLGDRIKEKNAVLGWVIVEEEEIKLAKYEKMTAEQFEPALRALEQKEEVLRKAVEEATASAGDGENQLNDVRARTEDAKKAVTAATRQHKTRQFEAKRKMDDVAAFDNNIRELETQKADAETRLTQARNAHLGGQTHKASLASDLAECTAQLAAADDSLKVAGEALSVAEEASLNASAELPAAERNLSDIVRAHDAKRREAAEQRQNLGADNRVTRFGNHFQRVIPAIEQSVQRGQFEYPPLGPVGQYLTVKDDKWAASIQDAIGNPNLVVFLVGNRRDMDLLKKIFADARAGRPRCIVVSGGLGARRHSIPASDIPRVHELGHCTVMDQLQVSNDDVFNMLVDHCSVESNVLVQGEEAMIQVSRDRSLRNVKVCWDEFGNRAYEKNRSHTVRPTERRPNSGCVLSADREGHVLSLEADAQRLWEQRQEATREVDGLKYRIGQVRNEERKARQNLNLARKRREDLLVAKMDLEAKVQEAASEFDAGPYEEEIESSENELRDAIAEKSAAAESVGALQGAAEAADVLRRDAAKAFEALRAEVKEKSSRLEEVGKNIGKKKAALRRIGPDIADARDTVKKAHQEIAVQKGAYTKALEDARAVRPERPELPTSRSGEIIKSEKLSQEIASMTRKLAEEEERRDGKSAEVIEKEYFKSQKKNIDNKKLMDRIIHYHKALKKGLEKRQKEKNLMELSIKKLVRTNFNVFLSTRDHRGKISFRRNDKGEKELVISTQMSAHKDGAGGLHKTSDLKSLSGGERSFTTLSLMLALAEVCQNPVRIMDEPDVFMDEATRHASFKALIDFCSSVLADRQTIIVTPLILPTGVVPTDDVRIVKLKAVSRRSSGGNQARIDDYLETND